MTKDEIPTIRIEVPAEFGDAYDGAEGRQWVERRQRISVTSIKGCQGRLFELLKDEEAFSSLCENMANVFVDWNLEGDEGPLPKPWKSPGAFEALVESDYELLIWVWGLTFRSMAELLDQAESKN